MRTRFSNLPRLEWLAIALVGAFLIVSTIVSMGSARRLIHNEQAIVRAHELINAAEVTLSNLKDAESGQRGYVSTGQVSYLALYNASCRRIDFSLGNLEQLAAADPLQQRLAMQLRHLVRSRLGDWATSIISRPKELITKQLVVTNEDQLLLDQCRQVTRQISNDARQQVALRVMNSEKMATRLQAAILLGLAAGIQLIAAITYSIRRSDRTRSKAEETLIESSRLSRSTLDALQGQIAILDDTGKIIATNQAWKDFGLANGGDDKLLSGGNYLEVCDRVKGDPEAEAAAVAAGIRAIIRGELQNMDLEYPCHSPTEQLWFIVHITRFAGEGPIRLVVAHENITAVKVAQLERESAFAALRESHEALYASEQRYRALTDAMPQMVWSALPNGYADYFNHGWTDYTGRTIEQEVGDGWINVIHPDDRERTAKCWRSAVANETPYVVEYRVKRGSDGAYRWHLARGLALRGTDGQIVHWYGTSTDIHDQKQFAEQLKAAKDAADAANRARANSWPT